MVEPGRGTRLPQGPRAQLGPLVVGQPGRRNHLLDRHLAVQHLVAGPPDPAHAARDPPGRTAGTGRRSLPAAPLLLTARPSVHPSQRIGGHLSVVGPGRTQHAACPAPSRFPSGMAIRSAGRRPAGSAARRACDAAVLAAGGGVAAGGPGGDGRPAVPLADHGAGPAGHPAGEDLVAEELVDRAGERVRVAVREGHPGHAGLDDLGEAAGARPRPAARRPPPPPGPPCRTARRGWAPRSRRWRRASPGVGWRPGNRRSGPCPPSAQPPRLLRQLVRGTGRRRRSPPAARGAGRAGAARRAPGAARPSRRPAGRRTRPAGRPRRTGPGPTATARGRARQARSSTPLGTTSTWSAGTSNSVVTCSRM